jgi:hypothetical protein
MTTGTLEFKLFYSNWAAKELTDLCGGLENIGTLFAGEDGEDQDISLIYDNIVKLVCILAKRKHYQGKFRDSTRNAQGRKKELLDAEMMSNILDMSKGGEYLLECLKVMGLASKFEMPDGMKTEEKDIDLEEIEAEKNP